MGGISAMIVQLALVDIYSGRLSIAIFATALGSAFKHQETDNSETL